ncbi:response regulator transcription factor [Candidatus Phyllobacterium onerii]|uniref:response regulator transcription factor n=1 Tax=Candidatus Phyllobacterium onerii TaxID=3020828 RepID=UPI00233067FA|nr:response regulator [Phyllobacterium sp. IY22]
MTPIIHIVDDDDSFRTALGRLIASYGFRVAFYESGDQFLTALPTPEPGCIVLDLQLPGLSGSALQERLAETAPLLPIIYLTGEGNIRAGVRAIKAGAEDFLEKPASGEALKEAIDRALLQNERRRAEYDRVHALEALVASLTPRESEVFCQMVRGKRNKQIAYAISTSERTVKAHRHCVMEKLGAKSLAEAVSIAERMGLLDISPKPMRRA